MVNSSSDPWFQSLFAERLGGALYGKGTEIYKFEKIKRAKRKALELYPQRSLLDFGIGENDDRADVSVREEMKVQVDRLENRGYADNGILEYKQAAAEWLEREFKVTLDPVSEICHCIGSKPAYALLPACFINPGDVTLMTVPGYPVAGTWTRYLGGEVVKLPLVPENNFFPDLDAIPSEVASRAKLLVLNYPNSPTGQVATKEFYQRAIEFAQRYQVIIVQDAAHIMLSFRGKPLSFLEIEGARDVGVEVHSMSKGYNMIGWRLGFVAGHPKIVQAFADVKDNSDSGQFMAIQHAGAKALRDPTLAQAVREKYHRRLQKLVQVLQAVGFTAEMPGGSYFLYTKAPVAAGDRSLDNAEMASQHLITEQSIVTVPWDDAGAFLRFSVTYQAETEQSEDDLMRETQQRLQSLRLRFTS